MLSLRSMLIPPNLTSVRELVMGLETFTQTPDSSVRRQAARAFAATSSLRIGMITRI
jgi:hypothetical protein